MKQSATLMIIPFSKALNTLISIVGLRKHAYWPSLNVVMKVGCCQRVEVRVVIIAGQKLGQHTIHTTHNTDPISELSKFSAICAICVGVCASVCTVTWCGINVTQCNPGYLE